MIPRQQWTDHIFSLDIDPGWAGNILTRVRDTEIRLHHYCKHLDDAQLSMKPDGGWSIKEHIGHLIDLELLHHGRLKELENFKKNSLARICRMQKRMLPIITIKALIRCWKSFLLYAMTLQVISLPCRWRCKNMRACIPDCM